MHEPAMINEGSGLRQFAWFLDSVMLHGMGNEHAGGLFAFLRHFSTYSGMRKQVLLSNAQLDSMIA